MIYHKATKFSFSLENQRFYFWVIGDTMNDPLLLLSGLTATHSDLLEMTSKLRESNFLIIPDLPGWGASPRLKQTLTLTNYSNYLIELINKLKIKKLNIFGHCMGGILALEFTRLYASSVKKLILVSIPYEEGKLVSKIILHLTDMGNRSPHFLYPIFYFFRNKYLNFLIGFYVVKVRSLRKKFKKLSKDYKNIAYEDNEVYKEGWTSTMHYDYSWIGSIKVPIHLIYGSKDPLISSDQVYKLQKLLPSKTTLEFIKEAGHIPPFESPEALGTLVLQYLK